MCTGVEVGYIIAAAGAATTAINQNQALRRTDRELARGIIEQGKLDTEAAARLRKEVTDLEASGPEADKKAALDAFRTALRENQDLAQGAVSGVPGASERFAENVQRGREQITGTSQTRAGLLSRIEGPIQQRQREGLNVARLGIDFGDIAQRSQSADFLARLRASQQQPDPFVNALGTFAQAFGGGLATSGASTGGANLGKLAKQGTLIDAPVQGTPTGQPTTAFG